MTSYLDYEVSDSEEEVFHSVAVSHHPGILIVDDMALILTMLKFALEPLGFAVWLATDADDALDQYRHNHAEIDVVLHDLRVPGMDGPQALAAVREIDSDVAVCFMTGTPDASTRTELLDAGAALVFDKPFQPAAMARSINELLRTSRSRDLTETAHRLRRRSYAINQTR